MTEKKEAILNISKTLMSVSFTMLAAIGNAIGNIWLAGLSALPGAGLASSESVDTQLARLRTLPWFDEWELIPGQPWQRALEKQIKKIKTAAVFKGKAGLGPWQHMELEAFLRQFVKRHSPVIPVILATIPKDKKPKLPVFLEGMQWVDFRKQIPDPLGELIWGVTGKRDLYL